ncbi:MAG: hypothetical protein KC776_23605 [Myxococcales bacterium]|nr:hypothetical protein [Myxococcales bacterium]MCB9580329.1 hypothetical protein [Polyangiaceae bacterium]
MTLRVAIASEYDLYDGEIYRFLLEKILAQPVERWVGDYSFTGNRSVVKLAPAFLATAARVGIRHAVLAVDNDGGAKRRPEHDEGHAPAPFDIDDDVRCRECWLTASIPARWSTLGGMTCVVVPVQVVETWLLCVRGDEFPREPERAFDRRALKTRFFGKPMPPVSTRIEMAIELLSAPHAMGALRKRPSYLRFEKRAVAWKSAR